MGERVGEGEMILLLGEEALKGGGVGSLEGEGSERSEGSGYGR